MKQGIWVERNVCCKAGRTEGHRRERLHKIPSRLWLQERRSLEDDQQVYYLLVTCEGLHLCFSDNLTLISKAQHFDILMVASLVLLVQFYFFQYVMPLWDSLGQVFNFSNISIQSHVQHTRDMFGVFSKVQPRPMKEVVGRLISTLYLGNYRNRTYTGEWASPEMGSLSSLRSF